MFRQPGDNGTEGKMANFIMLHQCWVMQEPGPLGGSRVELEPVFVSVEHIEAISTVTGSVVQLSSGEYLEVNEKPGEIIELIQGVKS